MRTGFALHLVSELLRSEVRVRDVRVLSKGVLRPRWNVVLLARVVVTLRMSRSVFVAALRPVLPLLGISWFVILSVVFAWAV